MPALETRDKEIKNSSNHMPQQTFEFTYCTQYNLHKHIWEKGFGLNFKTQKILIVNIKKKSTPIIYIIIISLIFYTIQSCWSTLINLCPGNNWERTQSHVQLLSMKPILHGIKIILPQATPSPHNTNWIFDTVVQERTPPSSAGQVHVTKQAVSRCFIVHTIGHMGTRR